MSKHTVSDADVVLRASADPAGRQRGRGLFGRRDLLLALGSAAAGGAAGAALGYRFRAEIRTLKLDLLARPLTTPNGMGEFSREALRISARHDQQTAESVATLKAKYETPVFGRVRVWDLVEKLAFCIDPTDRRLFCGSQFVHLQQILAAMEANGVSDPDMLLLAIVHDLGKVLLLTDELPENVVCGTDRIGGAEEGCGLDQVLFQFGHGEFLFSRLHGHVPDHVAWAVRYHNVDPGSVTRFMDERERAWAERYLIPFRRFDGGFVSPYFLPRIDLARYRDLIERTFPSPILV